MNKQKTKKKKSLPGGGELRAEEIIPGNRLRREAPMVVARVATGGGDLRDNDADRCAATITGQQTEHRTNTNRTPWIFLLWIIIERPDFTLLFDSTSAYRALQSHTPDKIHPPKHFKKGSSEAGESNRIPVGKRHFKEK